MNIQYPKITGGTAEQLVQIRGFLYQLVQQLNMESGTQNVSDSNGKSPSYGGTVTAPFTQGDLEGTASTPMSTFNQVKSLIIKSAEIVDAYYAEINRRLEGVYVAESDFGTYQREASAQISANADRIKQNYNSVQKITGLMNKVIDTQATIRSGLLFTVGEENLDPELGQTLPEGTEVYGIEIGQTSKEDGKEVFNKIASFTSYGMALYNENGDLTACFTDAGTHISNVTVRSSLRVGGFKETVYADGSSVERWVGV